MARRDNLNVILLVVLLVCGIAPGLVYLVMKILKPPFNLILFWVLIAFFVFPGIIYITTCTDY